MLLGVFANDLEDETEQNLSQSLDDAALVSGSTRRVAEWQPLGSHGSGLAE